MQFYSYRDNEFDKLIFRMTTPRVVIDNAACANATVVKVDSARKHGILLEAVQVLADLNLSVEKAYISSDGRWFMDVFHVTDVHGNKLTDESVISYMEQSLGTIHYGSTTEHKGLTALELTGTDRIGLLSEVFAVLSSLNCNIVDANVWTHNGRIASLIYVKDCDSGTQIEDSERINRIESMLRPVLKRDNDIRGSAMKLVSMAVTHTERRLHQMMFDDRDYVVRAEEEEEEDDDEGKRRRATGVVVTVQNWAQRGYSVINIQCTDRTKLLFDVVCTLTDMDYIIFHATVNTEGSRAYLEFCIRHKDGSPISSDPEMQRVIQCLQAAVERRATQGVRLELCAEDRPFLLAEVTRTFRENGLNVTRAEISTTGQTARNIFYVTDGQGRCPDPEVIQSVCQDIPFLGKLRVMELPLIHRKRKEDAEKEADHSNGVGGAMLFSLGSIVRRNLYNLGLIKSYS